MRITGIEFNVTMKVAEIDLNKEDYDAILAGDNQSHEHRQDRKKHEMMEDLLGSSKVKDILSDYVAAVVKQQIESKLGNGDASESESTFGADVEANIERVREEVEEFSKNFEELQGNNDSDTTSKEYRRKRVYTKVDNDEVAE